MINQYDIRNAMSLLVTAESLNSDSKHGEIALQLKLCMIRGEYRLGNFKEAVNCLVDAGYEVEVI